MGDYDGGSFLSQSLFDYYVTAGTDIQVCVCVGGVFYITRAGHVNGYYRVNALIH